MLQDLSWGYALLGVHFQHLCQQVHRLLVHFLVGRTIQIELHLSVVLVDFLKLATLEERLLDQQDMEDNTGREDIADLAGLLPLGKSSDLWGYVARRTASVKDIVLAVDICG